MKNFNPPNYGSKDQISNIRLSIPTFQTDLFGIIMLDQKQHKNEIFSATRWIFLVIPLFPLTHITFKINKIETIASQMTLFRLNVLESRSPEILDVLKVYLQIIIGFIPMILAVKYGDSIRNIFGLWGSVISIFGSIILFILLLIKMQNDQIDYKKYEV
jgi:hypothetical protein